MDYYSLKGPPSSSTQDALDVWTILFRRQISSGTLPKIFLERLNCTGFTDTVYPTTSQINTFLSQWGWSGIEYDAPLSFIEMVAHFHKQTFAVPTFIRNKNNLEHSKSPDFFSRCFSQLPMLFDEDYRKLLTEFGRLSQVDAADKEQFLIWLQRQYWYSIEKGILANDAHLQPLGVQLIDSIAERQHCLDPALHKVYGMHPVMRTPIAVETYPTAYYTFENYSQIKRGLLDFERMYKNA